MAPRSARWSLGCNRGSWSRALPLPLLRIAATAGTGLQRLGWDGVPLTRFRLDNLLTEMVYDLEPLHGIVGPPPIALDEGIRETADWLRSAGHAA